MSSLFDRIAARIAIDPDKPLDTSGFPKISVEGAPLSYAAGTLDALERRFHIDSKTSPAVMAAIDDVACGRLKKVAQLDRRLQGLRAGSNVDEVLERLGKDPPNNEILELFWSIALSSDDYDAVKWGIAIGGLRASRKTVEEMFVLARHGEFTIYAAVKLLAAMRFWPDLVPKIFELLEVLDGWAVIRLADLMARRDEFRNDPAASSRILKCALLQSGITMEVAYPFAQQLHLPEIFDIAGSDDDLFRAIHFMMQELLTLDPAPYGGITDLPNGASIMEAYVRLLEDRPVDIFLLDAIRTTIQFLSDPEVPFSARETWHSRCDRLMDRRYSEDLVYAATLDEKTRWTAMWLVKLRPSERLLDALRHVVATESDSTAIDLLGLLGNRDDCSLLTRRLPELVDLVRRSTRTMSKVNVDHSETATSFVYASIVQAIGRLGPRSADDVKFIRHSLTDFDPHVRAAACKAVETLDSELIDESLVASVAARLNDSPEYVSDAAHSTMRRLAVRG